jgi:hypothetical protein
VQAKSLHLYKSIGMLEFEVTLKELTTGIQKSDQ